MESNIFIHQYSTNISSFQRLVEQAMIVNLTSDVSIKLAKVLRYEYFEPFAIRYFIKISMHKIILGKIFLSDVCVPYSLQACEDAVAALGLQKGDPPGSPFVGNYKHKGCYAYNNKDYAGMAFYGTGGSFEQISTTEVGSGIYRPFGYDCSTNGNISYFYYLIKSL